MNVILETTVPNFTFSSSIIDFVKQHHGLETQEVNLTDKENKREERSKLKQMKDW